MKILLLLTLLNTGVLSPDSVRQTCIDYGIQHADIVTAQSIEETKWYTSYNFRHRNNLFGMKGGVKCDANEHGYRIYCDWIESIKGYKEWQDRRYTGGDYYEFLKRVKYSENPHYCDNVKKIADQLWSD